MSALQQQRKELWHQSLALIPQLESLVTQAQPLLSTTPDLLALVAARFVPHDAAVDPVQGEGGGQGGGGRGGDVEGVRMMMAEARAGLGAWHAVADRERVDLRERTDEAAAALLPAVGSCAILFKITNDMTLFLLI